MSPHHTVAVKHDHRVEMAGLAAVVGDVVDAAARDGVDVPADIAEPLALIERWLAGDDVGDVALRTARDRAFASGEAAGRIASAIGGSDEWESRAKEQHALRRVHHLSTAVGNLAEKARKPRGWDERAGVIDPAMWSKGGDAEAELERLEQIRAAAAERAKSRPAPAAPVVKRASVDVARLATRVGKSVARRLAKACDHGAIAGDADALRAALIARGYDASAEIVATLVAFDAGYGGLEPFLDGEDDAPWLLGALACVSSDAHVKPTGGRAGLVPVAYAPNDVIYFLDASGQPWGQDTIEDAAATPMNAANGDELIVLIVGDDRPKRAVAKVAKQPRRRRK